MALDHEESPSQLTSMRDLLDNPVISSDGRPLARVGDVEARWMDDGALRVERLLFGPETLANRLWARLGQTTGRLLRHRWETAIGASDVVKIGDEIHVRGPARAYRVGRFERAAPGTWLRYISGPRWSR
jgi:sporulation protein YlmC with PRC-barrel domain